MLSIASIQSIHAIARGSGACSPGKFLKLYALRLNLRAFLRIYIAIGIILTLAVHILQLSVHL